MTTTPYQGNNNLLKPTHTVQQKDELCTLCAADIIYWSSLQLHSSIIGKTRLPADHGCPMWSFLVGALRAVFAHWTFPQFLDRVPGYELFRPFLHFTEEPNIQANILLHGIPRLPGRDAMLSPCRTGSRLLDPDSVDFDVLKRWIDVC